MSPPLVNPTLLQLAGLGIENDLHIHDGRHLRWTFNPELGFPLDGFRLLRRPSPLPWNPKHQQIRVRRSLPGGHSRDGHRTIDGEAGLTVEFADGTAPSWQPGGVAGPPEGRWDLDRDGVTLGFFRGGDAALGAPTPACWVRLLVRVPRTGALTATAFFDRDGRRHEQDRARLGLQIPGPGFPFGGRGGGGLPGIGGGQGGGLPGIRGGSGGGRPGLPGGIPGISGRFGRSGSVLPGPVQSVLLHGSVIDAVRITGRSAMLLGVEWITVEDYAEADGWETLDVFRLPLDSDATVYPGLGQDGEALARARLHHAPPRLPPYWDAPGDPPRRVNPGRLASGRAARYLADYPEMARQLRRLLHEDVTFLRPQRQVLVDDTLQPRAGTSDQLRDSGFAAPVMDLVQIATADPQMARVLGLGTVDVHAPAHHPRYDYMVVADWWFVWLLRLTSPSVAEPVLAAMQAALDGADDGEMPRIPRAITRSLASVVTGLELGPSERIAAPEGLSATVEPRAGREPLSAVVSLSWQHATPDLFSGRAAHLMYALRRQGGGPEVGLNARDEATDLALPLVPASETPPRFTDTSLSAWGPHTYRLSGMDLWGRFSPYAELAVTVEDRLPPPPPGRIEAALEGDDGPPWTLVISWDWTRAQQRHAPDLAEFHLHAVHGSVAPDGTVPERGVELGAARTDAVDVSWPDLEVTSPISGITATSDVAPTRGDDTRITVRVPGVAARFDTEHRARVSVTVVAVDDAGNRSSQPRRKIAERIAPVPPDAPVLTLEPQVATYPDAAGWCHWPCEWPAAPGTTTTVLRASQAQLLALGDVATAAFDGMATTERMQTLRGLAIQLPHAFSPDHARPYDTETRHLVGLPRDDRGWTVVTVQRVGPTGTRSPWPTDRDRFAVVRTPDLRPPPTPRVTVHPEVDHVRVHVAPDTTGVARSVMIFRASDLEDTDTRRMRLLARASLGPAQAVEHVDPAPPGVWRAYTAVALNEVGIRSAPSALAWARARAGTPPAPPVVSAVQPHRLDPTIREVSVELERIGVSLTVQRRHRDVPGPWRTVFADSPEAARDVAPLQGGGVQVTVMDDAGGQPGVREYRAVVVDPEGRSARSDVFTE